MCLIDEKDSVAWLCCCGFPANNIIQFIKVNLVFHFPSNFLAKQIKLINKSNILVKGTLISRVQSYKNSGKVHNCMVFKKALP